MELMQPSDWEEALDMKARHPEAVPIAGGTDVMVELNFARRRPETIIDLGRIAALREHGEDDGVVRLGAAVPYTRIVRELAGALPGLAIASRTVGSPQIRNRGTVGGNLGAASPAGDSHPPLLAAAAEVEVTSLRGSRVIPIRDFYVGPKRNALAGDELIAAIRIPRAPGAQQFAKIGSRNAMVIAACSFAIALDPVRRRVGTGIGSAGPTPLSAPAAERFLADALDEANAWEGGAVPTEATLQRFGELVAAAARPIDDVRAAADYRRHALRVLAARTARWSLTEEAGACA